MCTFKVHALNCVANSLRHLGSIENLEAGSCDSYYELFKEKYRKSSKRAETAMTEVLMKTSSERYTKTSRKSKQF